MDILTLQTLPPIQHPSADEERETCKALESMNKNLWAKPLPPRPFIMHLGLTARTHDILNFQENFPLDYGNFYINRYVLHTVIHVHVHKHPWVHITHACIQIYISTYMHCQEQIGLSTH